MAARCDTLSGSTTKLRQDNDLVIDLEAKATQNCLLHVDVPTDRYDMKYCTN